MNALRVETCILYMYFKETSLISHASLESWNKESIKLPEPMLTQIYAATKPQWINSLWLSDSLDPNQHWLR